MKKTLLLIVMGWVVLAVAACSQPSAAKPVAGCPEATADLQQLHNPRHGYCLLYPAEYKVEKPNENETILVIGGLLNAGDPRVHLSAEPASGRTAVGAAEEFMAAFLGDVDIEEFGIERSTTTVAGETVQVLDNLPGQDINRRVIFVHDDLLYNLTFLPVLDNDNQPTQRMETFYRQILDSFTFIPQSDEVVEECLTATADNQLLKIEEHGYCLLLPGEYETERPNESETVFFVGSLMDVAHPKLFVTVEDAGERTAAQAAEEMMAAFPPDFGIQPVGGVTIGYEWAEQLDNVPGQDISRVVLAEHDGRLYRLTFVPASEDAGEVYRQMEALYDLVLKSFRFLPIQATPTASATNTSDSNDRFDCNNVSQIRAIECQALVALYNNTDGANWADNSGWLATNTPCTWSGIDCTDGHVSHINLLYNQLTGSLPPELGNLSHLAVLGLWVNQLQGSIPAELGELSELAFLDLSGNQLTGPLPAELGHLTNLQSLSLVNNQFSGSIPAALGKMERLESLDLSYNQFSGPIPAELSELVNLNALRLSHNQLSGSIPSTFGKLSQLTELDLSYNQLSGPVPELVTQIAQRRLWGNQLEGTIASDSRAPITVDYKGVHFAAAPWLAISIWPEVIPATSVPEGEPIWYAAPPHVRFTFADLDLSPARPRMGINLAAEAQILIYPLAELAALDPSLQAQIETVQSLLSKQGPVPEGDLPLLPVTNAAQVFQAQVQYLVSDNIQGLRFISQHSQEARPVFNQELFYTFQGFTNDGIYYVAAFFPLTTAVLPNEVEVEDWDAFHAKYDTYLWETTAVLDQLPPTEFTPDLTVLDAIVTSLRLGPEGVLLD